MDRDRAGRKTYLKLFLLPALAGFLMGPAASAWALTFSAEEQLTLPSSQTVADAWYAAGREVRIEGRVQRDALVAGEHLSFNGAVDQDMMVAAQNGLLGGTIGGDLRAVGEVLTVSSEIGQGAVLFARELRIAPVAVIGEGLLAGAQKLTVGGRIHGRTELFGDEVRLEGSFDQDVTVHCRTLQVGESARVPGTLTYYSDAPVQMAPGAQAGQVTWISAQKSTVSKNWWGAVPGKSALINSFKLLLAVTLLLLGTLLVWLLPHTANRYAAAIQSKVWSNLGWGLLVLIGVPLLGIFFALTVLGIPLAGILFVLYFFGIFLSKLGVGYALGRIIFKKQPQLHPVPVFLVGFALLAAVGFIPVLGSVIGWLAMILGLGGLITLLNTRPTTLPAPAAGLPVAPPVAPAATVPVPTPRAEVAMPAPAAVASVAAPKKRTSVKRTTVKRVVKPKRAAAPRKRSSR